MQNYTNKKFLKNIVDSKQKKEIEELEHKKTFVPQAMKNIKEASDDERDTETPSRENQPAKEGNVQSWGARVLQNRFKIGAGAGKASSTENQLAKEGNGQSWRARIQQNRFKIIKIAVCLVYVAVGVGLYIDDNLSNIVCDPVNSTENDTLSLNLPSTCPNLMQHPYWLQCKIDENVTKLANAEKWYVDSSSSIVSNPVDSTENYTSYLYSLVLSIAGIVISYGLDMDIAVPRESFGL
ncbi:hypothetical protein HC358_03995 [Wolbachia pipientis]|uniref:Uncharacterized protein n=1 Tax=Wolbachia pipientis TaxID=955 RepID=A0A7G5CAH0_WOLPI|nr:hypothetical protein [Wolbachia pipientis]QMV46204.1 hypothetical protein HC358_03995 [Wolbachia pipientis]